MLKKIRLNHPWFRKMAFNSFKMIFDNCQMVQIRWGQKLYKQDTPITDIYFVIYGKISLSYIPQEGDIESLKTAGHLGYSLGEEILFYQDAFYRETAICETRHCCLLRMTAHDLVQLGDNKFENRNLSQEQLKNDIDGMFEQLGHIFNYKETWRI